MIRPFRSGCSHNFGKAYNSFIDSSIHFITYSWEELRFRTLHGDKSQSPTLFSPSFMSKQAFSKEALIVHLSEFRSGGLNTPRPG